jgi:hypothetical protein
LGFEQGVEHFGEKVGALLHNRFGFGYDHSVTMTWVAVPVAEITFM